MFRIRLIHIRMHLGKHFHTYLVALAETELIRIEPTFYHLYIEPVLVKPLSRNNGIGKALIWLNDSRHVLSESLHYPFTEKMAHWAYSHLLVNSVELVIHTP